MAEATITERVIQTIAKTPAHPAESIQPNSTFAELKIDSLDGLQILFALEEEFNISIPDDEAKKLKSIDEVVKGVETLLGAPSA